MIRVHSPIEMIHGSHCLPPSDSGKGTRQIARIARLASKASCVISKVLCWFIWSARICTHNNCWIYLYYVTINGNAQRKIAPLANTNSRLTKKKLFLKKISVINDNDCDNFSRYVSYNFIYFIHDFIHQYSCLIWCVRSASDKILLTDECDWLIDSLRLLPRNSTKRERMITFTFIVPSVIEKKCRMREKEGGRKKDEIFRIS